MFNLPTMHGLPVWKQKLQQIDQQAANHQMQNAANAQQQGTGMYNATQANAQNAYNHAYNHAYNQSGYGQANAQNAYNQIFNMPPQPFPTLETRLQAIMLQVESWKNDVEKSFAVKRLKSIVHLLQVKEAEFDKLERTILK